MTDLKFNILKLLYNTYPLRELSRMDIFKSIPDDKLLIHNALKELQARDYIQLLVCSDVFKLTSFGAESFENVQEERDKATKKESQQRFDNKISIASVLIPSITFLLGILFEHFTDFVAFLISLFK